MFIKKTSPRAAKSGFSLIELLLVMTLVPVLFFAVYANFSAGLKIWTRLMVATPEEDLNIFTIKIKRDLQQMMRFSVIPFAGEKEEISFAASIETLPELGGERGIGHVRISYDPQNHQIVREIRNYNDWARDHDGQKKALLQHVTFFELSYLSKDPQGEDYVWSDLWNGEANKLPLAVKVMFSLEGSSQGQQKVVFIPTGGQI